MMERKSIPAILDGTASSAIDRIGSGVVIKVLFFLLVVSIQYARYMQLSSEAKTSFDTGSCCDFVLDAIWRAMMAS